MLLFLNSTAINDLGIERELQNILCHQRWNYQSSGHGMFFN